METVKPGRRTWSQETKNKILEEADLDGFSTTAKKYEITTSLLFHWRKQLRSNSNDSPVVGNEDSKHDLRSLMNESGKLAKIQKSLANKLEQDVAKGEISSYNASCALSNLHNSLSKLEALQSQAIEKMNLLENAKANNTRDEHAISDEIRKFAEMILVIKAKHRLDLSSLFSKFDQFLTEDAVNV
jgi:transposase-like protein